MRTTSTTRFLSARSLALTTAAAATIALAPAAQADAIDDALAKLPSGPISCDQAKRYWTNEADYNSKVRQAQTLAMFDRRGPQILEALGRVDEAATRCGLKGGGAAPAQPGRPAPAPAPAQPAQPAPAPAQPAQPAPSQPAQPAPSQPAQPAPAPAPAPAAQNKIVLAPSGVPSFEVPINGIGTFVVPDLLAVLINALASILNFFNIKVPGIN